MARHITTPHRAVRRRTARLRLTRALAGAAALALAITGIATPAAADSVLIDVAASGTTTITAGGSTTMSYYLVERDRREEGDGGQNNCNVTSGNPGTLRVSAPAGVTVSTPAPLTGCGPRVPVTFSSATPGAYTVTVSVTGGIGGVFNTAPATFTLTVQRPADTTPPVLALPGALSVQATGPSGAPVSWTASAYDGGDAAPRPVSCTPASGSVLPLGTTPVTCTSVDSRGNIASGTFTASVVDTTGPALTLTDVTVEAQGPGGATVPLGATATDLVDGARPVTCVPAAGSTFGLGATTVTCTSTDTRSNTSSGTLTVTVADTTPPSITVTNQTLEATSGAGAVATFAPTATDLVSGSRPVTCDRASGTGFALGETTVTCTATDAAGILGTASFTITVADTTAPSLTLTGTTAEATGPDGAEVTFTASASDLVDGDLTVSCSPVSGSLFALGSTTVACSAVDRALRTAIGSLVVTVLDRTPPALTLPDVVLEATDEDGVVATVDGTGATARDVVDGVVSVVCEPLPDTRFALGTTTVRCSATDRAGNTATGDRLVRVQDTTAPVVTPPVLDVVEATSGDGATVTFAPTVFDAVHPGLAATCTPASGSTFALGTTSVACSARDGAGNTGGAAFTVTVVDTTAPAYAPADVTVEATGPDGATATWSTEALDLVDGPVEADCSPRPGGVFPLGDTRVTCDLVDARSNSDTAFLTVTVRDTTGPALTVPGTIDAEATGPDGAPVEFAASATDAVDGSRDVTCTPASGSTFPLGSATVTCTAVDSRGNGSSSAFLVVVRDTTAPVLTGTSPTVEATGPAGAPAAFAVTAADLVDADVAVTCDATSGQVFGLGVTPVECWAVDDSGNRGTGSITVTVGDSTAPALTLPGDLVTEATGPGGAVVAFAASASDIVDGGLPVGCVPPSGSLFALGSTTVTCTATDTRSNRATGTISVTVQDTTAPQLSLPGDQRAEATGPGGAPVTFAVTATDAVTDASDVTVACVPASGTTFPVGTTTVRCTATDEAGNVGRGSVDVVVTDTTAPVLSPLTSLTAEATGATGAPVTFAPTASDVVDGTVVVTCTPPSGSTFPLTTTNVDCRATDRAGNTATGSFTVTVRDTTEPVITVGSVVSEATGPAGAVVTYSATATDLVDGPLTVSCTPVSGSLFGLGSTGLSCTAVDTAGNRSTVTTASVTVQDTTAPTLTVPADRTVTATSPAGAPVAFVATATDLVDATPLVVCDRSSGSTFPLGVTTVTCTATDDAGKQSTATFRVTVALEWSALLAPIGNDGRSAFKAGSTVPVKFRLTGDSAPATGTPATLSVAKVGAASGSGDITVVSTTGADAGSMFRVADGQYVFNLSTKGWGEGQYVIRVDLGDGVERMTTITVRR